MTDNFNRWQDKDGKWHDSLQAQLGQVIAELKEASKAVNERDMSITILTRERDEAVVERDNWKRNADARWDGLVQYEKELDELREKLQAMEAYARLLLSALNASDIDLLTAREKLEPSCGHFHGDPWTK